ncbi:MAG: Flp family type IVb pilin [Terriglobales bacterium]
MTKLISRFWRDDRGQDMAEYAIVLGVIAAVTAVAFTALGTDIKTVLGNISTAITGPAAG